MDNFFWWYKWHARISSNSTAGCKIWRNFQSRCPSPAQMCHVTPWACAQETPLGEMASFCLLILEEEKQLGKWECFGWYLVHVSGAAFQSNNSSDKDRSHKLEMYPVWPNWGFLLSDSDFVLRMNYTKLVRRKHSICVCVENVPEWTEEGKIEPENCCWYSHPISDSS